MQAPQSIIGLLMYEHRTIMKVVDRLCALADDLDAGRELDPDLVDVLVDFLVSYADECHHGKEERILFERLKDKQLAEEDAAEMRLLMEQHEFARAQKRAMASAKERFCAGDVDARKEMSRAARALGDMYPGHVALEDKHFFPAALAYLPKEERDELSALAREYDRMLIHLRYGRLADELLEGLRQES